jgi:hypothetical protein
MLMVAALHWRSPLGGAFRALTAQAMTTGKPSKSSAGQSDKALLW